MHKILYAGIICLTFIINTEVEIVRKGFAVLLLAAFSLTLFMGAAMAE